MLSPTALLFERTPALFTSTSIGPISASDRAARRDCDLLEVGHVECQRMSVRAEGRGKPFQLARIDVAHRDRIAVVQQPLGGRQPHAARGARDQRDLPALRHRSILTPVPRQGLDPPPRKILL